jgi:hypothetical protein
VPSLVEAEAVREADSTLASSSREQQLIVLLGEAPWRSSMRPQVVLSCKFWAPATCGPISSKMMDSAERGIYKINDLPT